MTNNNKSEENAKFSVPKTYRHFETLIIRVLVVLISLIILAAFWGLMVETYHLILHGAFETLDHKAFQSVFGMIMTLLIAIEFNHTIMHAHIEENRVVIAKTVVLVAILAVSRQFIVIEIESISPLIVAALAFSLLSLGIVYWLMERALLSSSNKLPKD